MPWLVFRYLGGYDQQIIGMGVQDADLLHRAGMMGDFQKVANSGDSGFSVPNREDHLLHLLTLGTNKRKQIKK